MQKVKLLTDYKVDGYEFQKDTYRVIMDEDKYNYFIQTKLDSNIWTAFSKLDDGCIYQVVERS